jgi:hypothetical protein
MNTPQRDKFNIKAQPSRGGCPPTRLSMQHSTTLMCRAYSSAVCASYCVDTQSANHQLQGNMAQRKICHLRSHLPLRRCDYGAFANKSGANKSTDVHHNLRKDQCLVSSPIAATKQMALPTLYPHYKACTGMCAQLIVLCSIFTSVRLVWVAVCTYCKRPYC